MNKSENMFIKILGLVRSFVVYGDSRRRILQILSLDSSEYALYWGIGFLEI